MQWQLGCASYQWRKCDFVMQLICVFNTFFSVIITSLLELHHTFQLKSTQNQGQLYKYTNMIQQFAEQLPYAQHIYSKAEQLTLSSTDRLKGTYRTLSAQLIIASNDCHQFSKDLQLCFQNIARETTNEILTRVEKVVGVKEGTISLQASNVQERILAIYQTIWAEYLVKYNSLLRERSLKLVRSGKSYFVDYSIPVYIHLKAALIVSKEMMMEFIESRLSSMKMTYECSKDTVVMYVQGNFKEENIRQKLVEGLEDFRQLSVEVVNKGLKIRIDRKALTENYDKFTVQLLELVKEMREKGEDNIVSIKKRSQDLYKEVVQRIRAKELEIKCDMKLASPLPQAENKLEL